MIEYLLKWSTELHLTCIQMISETGNANIKSALICGHYNKNLEFANFGLSGLAHLLVISGAHLHYIESSISKLCRWLRCPEKVVSITFLGLFTLITNGNPPVFRAFCQSAYKSLNSKYSLHWPPPLVCLISGITCLILRPDLWQSPSLILSWLATLIISLPISNSWALMSLLYLSLLPFTWSWGYTPHPMSIALNVLISPLFLSILLPLSFLSVIYSPLDVLYAEIWHLFLKSLHLFSNSFPGTPHNGQFSHLIYFWVYLSFLQWGAYWLHIYFKRSL